MARTKITVARPAVLSEAETHNLRLPFYRPFLLLLVTPLSLRDDGEGQLCVCALLLARALFAVEVLCRAGDNSPSCTTAILPSSLPYCNRAEGGEGGRA